MFDIGASELLVIVVVAILVIGPKDMPMALRSAGRWIGKMRRMSNHFRAGIDNMIREAEMEEAEREWRERNARIMADHPEAGERVRDPDNLIGNVDMEPTAGLESGGGVSAETAVERVQLQGGDTGEGEPELPLGPSRPADGPAD